MSNSDGWQTAAGSRTTYDLLQFKASHNTYERSEKVETVIRFRADKPSHFGCRGIEYDLHQNQGGFAWSVKHLRRDANEDFEGFLAHLQTMSEAHPGHDVITVTLDLKYVEDDGQDFPDAFDAYLRASSFDEGKLLTPDEVVSAGGIQWPTLTRLRGKFIFCVSGDEEYKSQYAPKSNRLCFADWALGPASIHGAPYDSDPRVFINLNAGHWMNKPQGPPLRPGYVYRVWGVETPTQWSKFQQFGFNLLATDHIRSYFASVSTAHPFARRPATVTG